MMSRPDPEPAATASSPASNRWRRRRRVAGLVYLALLALSTLVRWLERGEPAVPPGLHSVEVAAVDGTRALERPVRLAYREWTTSADDPRPVLVLLHGSPGDGSQMAGLGKLLGRQYHVLAPDLPGFGASTHDIPDYSFLAHSLYVEELLDALAIERVHVVAFSMGGGVALHLAARSPSRVASLTLLSALGVQEFEMLGQYHLNHALHALQLLAIWGAENGLPHFGLLDHTFFDVPYARNFYDSDQRPLRGILQSLAVPTLILHGRHDVLVPFAAAEEHHRLVPQSELVAFDANHFMVFAEPEILVDPIEDFVGRVESGVEPDRAEAPPERVAEAAEPEGALPPVTGLAKVVWCVLLILATLISEDLTCLGAGLLVAHGRLDFIAATVACAAGIFFGDFLLYLGGRLGRPWLHRPPLKWFVDPRSVANSRKWFHRRGPAMIFFSRFLPGARIPVFVTAGLLRMPVLWFTACLLVPIAIWTPLLVGLAWLFGDRMLHTFDLFGRYAVPGFLLILAIGWGSLIFGRALVTHNGRRRLVGLWHRLTKWEFWPLWAFYPPVVLYILRLGLRHRSFTLFTAANPAIPASGFIGESKAQILEQLDPAWVARFARIAGDLPFRDKLAAVADFAGSAYPVVLKPDQGERGRGVVIAQSDDDVAGFFRGQAGDAIVQEYVAGPELGVFYVRHPDEERGRIFSITDKRLPSVSGDGLHSIERLILDDPRAVALADVYLARLGPRREEIPARGEEIRLVEIGTHCRGAVFLDGDPYRTPELEAAIDRVSQTFEGFYFGRYDLRAPSLEAFREGRDFKVLELNGVTSEATAIYDPKNRLRDAYAILFAQWRLAFEIGAANRERGVAPVSARELLRLFFSARRKHKDSTPEEPT